jgi:hypothetical protein
LPSWNDGATKPVGAFTQALYDKAQKDGGVVISMKATGNKSFRLKINKFRPDFRGLDLSWNSKLKSTPL